MTTNEIITSKGPTHTVYTIREGKKGGKGFFIRIGAAWQTKDGQGLNVKLDAFPVNGSLTILPAKQKVEASE